MTTKVDCPHCGARLRLRAAGGAAHVRCAACKEVFEPRRVAPGAPPDPGARPAASGGGSDHLQALFDAEDGRPAGSEGRSPLAISDVRVPTLLSGLYGLGLTLLLAMLLQVVPADGLLARLFSHGMVSFFTAFFSLWAVCILALKAKGLALERKALRFDVLSQDAEQVIRATNVHRFTAHLRSLPERLASTILFRRISNALEYFRSTGSSTGVSSYLASQNDLDVGASESSYTMVRAFIWAVPILGFIGTVFGLGEAVNSFAVSVDAAKDVDAIRSSLGGVTSGLGMAFETTLIALIISILLLIPTNWLQKTEDDLLTAIGSYCNEELIWRFERSEGVAPDGAPTGATSGRPELLDRAMDRVVEQAAALGTTLRGAVEAVQGGLETSSKTLGEGLPKAIADLHAKVEQSFQLTSEMLAAQQDMRERFSKAASSESPESLLLKVDETHRRMLEVLERMSKTRPRRWWRLFP